VETRLRECYIPILSDAKLKVADTYPALAGQGSQLAISVRL